jgi:hypothetical protein
MKYMALQIAEFTALNPKVYSINHQKINDKGDIVIANKKACKGVSKVVVKNEIKHDDFVHVLQTNEPLKKDTMSIRSFNHKIYTVCTPKVALTSYYDKMVMVDCNDCIPYGYKNI